MEENQNVLEEVKKEEPPNKDKTESSEENKDYHFIYFIESHDKTRKIESYLSPEYKNSDTLELLPQMKLSDYSDIKKSLISNLYRFKIFPENCDKNKQEQEITIFFTEKKDENNEEKINKSEYTLKIRDYRNDFYDYDLYDEKLNIVKLPYEQKFELYIYYLQSTKAKQGSKEYNEFILSSQRLLAGAEQRFDFLFYLLIFLECFTTKLVHRLLFSFKPKKIRGLGKVPSFKIKQMGKILNFLAKKPEKIRVEKEESRKQITGLFYFVLLYFNLNFDKEKINDMLNDDQIFEYVYKNFFQHTYLFEKMIISNELVCKLLKKVKEYNEILISLSFLGKNFLNFLIVINKMSDLIIKFIAEEEKKIKEKKNEEDENENKNRKTKKVFIEAESFVDPKLDDDLGKILDEINILKKYEMNTNRMIVKFSPNIIEQYINFNIDNNFQNLIILNNIIVTLKALDKDFKCQKNMDLIIHDTGLNLVKNGLLKNKQLLDFIRQDVFYQSKLYKNPMYKPLNVFDGIDILTLDDKFYENWRKMEFYKIFEANFSDFTDKIASLIKEMKDFKILLKLLSSEKGTNEITQYMITLQKRFIELYNTYSKEKCPNFINDTVELIFLNDKYKITSLKKLLVDHLQKLYNKDTVNEIYISLTENYKTVSKETITIIIDFFLKDKTNSQPLSLVNIIQKCNNIRQDIFSNLNIYTIDEEDFFNHQELDSCKFVEGLIENKILEKGDIQKTTYITKLMETISIIKQKIENFELYLGNLNLFFRNTKDKSGEAMLLKRLLIIYNEEPEKAKFTLDKLKAKIEDVNNKIKKLDIIYNDFDKFFNNLHRDKLNQLLIIIQGLKSGLINTLDKEYLNDYNNYLQYYENALKRQQLSQSIFFHTVYKEMKTNIKEDDVKCLEEAEKMFDKFKAIFEEKGLNKIDEQLLQLCLKPFKDNENGLYDEIKRLAVLFKINEDESLDQIYQGLIIISKKEYIFNISSSIKLFIEIIQAQHTKFTNDLDNIVMNLKNSKDINTIINCKKILDQYGININEKDNKYIDILLKLKIHPESVILLLKTTLQDCRNLQELSSESDNVFISINDLLDMEKCVEFLLKLGKDLKKKNDIDIIQLMKENASKDKNISLYFKNFVDNFSQIKLLMESSLNKSEVLKYKIQGLLKGASIILSNSGNDSFTCSYYSNELKKEQKLDREKIINIKEKAQMAKIITSEYKCFIQSVTEIINIYNILQDIYMKGYPKKMTIKIILAISKKNKEEQKNKEDEYITNNKYYLDNEQKDNFMEIIDILKNILTELHDKQINAYETKSLVRFIYGRQFDLLYENFNLNNNIAPLLKYITNDSYQKDVQNFQAEKINDIIESNINNCEKYLNEVLNVNKITLDDIYKNTLIKKKIKPKNQGLFTFLCEKLEKDLFQIFKYLTGNNPIAQNILLCKKNTSNEEITSFLYRAYKCEYNSCFIFGGLELISYEKKSFIIQLLDQFFQKGNKEIKSCLIFFFIKGDSDIYKILSMKAYKNTLNIDKKLYDKEKYEGNDIEVIKSDKSGVGKSTQIKKDIEDKKKTWIYFPFGGVFTSQDIIRRLKELKIRSDCVIHLDLYDTDQISLMMDFLFSLLITRFYGQNEDIFYLSKNIQIKIEIPNSFIDFFLKFPILTLFNIKEMKISNLSPLIVPEALDSNIQIVANYLKSLKEGKIDNYDLIIPNVTPIDFQQHIIKIVKKEGFFKKKKEEKKVIYLNAEKITQKECQELIFDAIKKTIPNPTYYQIISFINVLAVQLIKLNKNFYLNAFELILSGKKINRIRTIIVESFIKLTNHFTEGAFTNLIKGQEKVHQSLFGEYDEEKDINDAVNDLANDNHNIISFDKINPSLLFFHEGDGEQFSIITNKKRSDKEYKDLLELKNSQCRNEKDKLNSLPNHKSFTKIQFLEEIKNILDIKNPVKEETESEESAKSAKNAKSAKSEKNAKSAKSEKTAKSEKSAKSEWKSLEEITGNYVFTADNFVKMVLILLRIRSNIPIIMMGETGCGKTSLIRKLSELKNNGNANKMKILNIHAGTNDNDIIDFINKMVIPDAVKLEKENQKEREKRKSMGLLFEEDKIWVFLDEINTCKSMGLISEMMCKHTCKGKPIPSNIVFIAACNPYRKRENKGQIENNKVGLDIKFANQQKLLLNDKERQEIARTQNSKLVYMVNPLPHSLLNYVFDFGNLTEGDEKEYIKCIIKEAIEKVYFKINKKIENNLLRLLKLKELAYNMVIFAHNFIRSFSDKSAVSLREIRRFNIFYEFFFDYLNKRKEVIENEKLNVLDNGDNDFYEKLDEFSLQAYAINLSVFVCYYLRITDKKLRKELLDNLDEIFKKFDPSFNDKHFIDLPLKEEHFIINNIKLDKGIAKNRALLENIFSLFVAINNKVPIFIVGKPGCSKSLSFQLLSKSMQGKSSENPFFRNYPKLMVFSYQGSMASTSKGVENIFMKARTIYQKLSKEDKENNISMIYFDEMGLAEHSPHNPLKVIHAELEYDQNEGDNKIAFVGISNWALDASKMNRGISISIPEPNEEDNSETSLTIGKSYNEHLAERYKKFYENLGLIYFEYKNYLKEKLNANGKEDFHGNRDFYHLVKNASKNMIIKEDNHELNDDTLLECGISSIERNFGGLQFKDMDKKTSLEIIKEIFKKRYPNIEVKKEYNIMQRIKENINDLNSRYLLLISKSSLSTVLLSTILSEEQKEYNFYIGSKFKADKNREEYSQKVLSKIQVNMENGNILILKDLESVYPALYDLFNQNFTVLSNKKYARLAVGSSVNTFSLVNDNFRCIVNVDIDDIDDQEAPFLNRFEKHIMSFEYLLDKELIKESNIIKSNLNELVKYNEKEFLAINYDLSKLLINCNIDEIQALIYNAVKNGKKNDEITDYVLSKIALTLPQDIIINMKCNKYKEKNLHYYQKILEYYGKGEHSNFADFLKQMDNYKNVIYTFSNSLETIKNIKDINNPLLDNINNENITFIKISSIKTENELEIKLDEFYNDDKHKICLIQFTPNEGDFMNYVKYLIDNKEKNYENIKLKKCFIFVVYMTRTIKDSKNLDKKGKELEALSNLSGYYQIFIDNLNGESNLRLEKIIEMDLINLLKTCVDLDKELISSIYDFTSYMKYEIFASYKGINKDNYISTLIDFISKNNNLISMLNESLFKAIMEDNEDNNQEPIGQIFRDKKILHGDETDLISPIKEHALKKYRSLLLLLFFKAEKDQFFSSLLTNDIERKKQKEEKNKGENILIDKLTKLYLDKLSFKDRIKVIERPKGNKVPIMLGLKIPGIKVILDSIIKIFKEQISKKYRENENNIRGIIDADKKDEEVENYFKELKAYNNLTFNAINKEKRLCYIMAENQKDIEELYNLIINDYYSLFINTNLNNNQIIKNEEPKEGQEEEKIVVDIFDDNKKLLDLMTKKRNQSIKLYKKQNENEVEENVMKRMAQNLNFIQSYQEEITFLLKIFIKLNIKVNNLYNQMEDIIEQKLVKYEISYRNPEYTSIANEVFFLCLDSMIRAIISNDKIYNIKGDWPEDSLYYIIKTYKEVLQDGLQLDNNLSLRSKETLSLHEIVKIFDAFINNGMVTVENVKEVIKYFGEENRYNNENNSVQLCDNLDKFYEFLLEKLGKNENNKNYNYYKILSFIFLNEFIKINSEDFREQLFTIILENDDFIKNSSQIIRIVIDNIIDVNDPEEMIGNLDKLKEVKNSIVRKINNMKNEFLDQVLLNIFEGKISAYFDSINNLDDNIIKEFYPKYYKDNENRNNQNQTGIVFDNSLLIFKEYLKFLDECSFLGDNEERNKNENIHLSKLFTISYVKMYLSKSVYFIVNKYKEMGRCKDIMQAIKIRNKKFENIIKIYILKLFYDFMNNNFEQLKNYNYKEKDIEFYENFDFGDAEKDEAMLTHLFLPLDKEDYTKYCEGMNKFEMFKKDKFATSADEMNKLIQELGINIFLDISINKIISKLGLNNYITDKNEYQSFSSSINVMITTSKPKVIDDKVCKLLNLFYDDKTYIEKMQPIITNKNGLINQELFEILLYGYKFCINSIDNQNQEDNKYLYESLLNKDYLNVIDKCYIPGIEGITDYHLETYDDIINHFKKFEDTYGCYVCSCGFYYYINPCGFPSTGHTFKCPYCKELCGHGEKILKNRGATNHGMVIRKGHYRIFKDAKQKVRQMSRWNDPDENIPNIFLDKYKKEIIEPLLKKEKLGFNAISRKYFEKKGKKVRDLTQVGYRLLNFIAYCHLFFGYHLGYISDENYEKCFVKDMDILEIIQTDWNYLKDALQAKKVSSIQIFMNMIFKKLSKLIKECKYITEMEKRVEFEYNVEKIIKECINNYQTYSEKYKAENQKQLNLSNYDNKTLITQLVEPTETIYPEKDYPMFKYFILTKYKTKQDFEKSMNSKEKYPLISQILSNNQDIHKLKHLIPFKEFTNYMIDSYSFKISRDDAKKRILKDEPITKELDFNNKFKEFIGAWNEIKDNATKYLCREEMPVKSLSINDKLIYFLIDDGELCNGMYLAAAFQKFIEWQNAFLEPIVNANDVSGILHHYVDNIKKKIPIQDAKDEQILLIEDRLSDTKYNNIKEIIGSFSERNIFGENGKIKYSDYNSFIYDYDAIEEELGKIILPGVCSFESETKLNFITFWSEGFRGGRSEVISDLYLKYEQLDLNDKEREIIIKYIDKMNKEKMAKNNMKYDFKDFFGSIQKIVFYLTEATIVNKNDKIINILNNAPKYLKISNDCYNFFLNDGNNINTNKLMNVFFYFEHLCFEDLAETLQPEYKQKIPEDNKNQIINKLLNKYDNKLYTIKDLGAAVRRFISRYLSGKTDRIDINEKNDLSIELSRAELWEQKIGNVDGFERVIKEQLQEFNLTVGQAYDFYEIIGMEDKTAI